MAYASITVEGGLFPSDLLDRIATGDVEGQRAADFGIDGRRRLADEIQSAFSDARSFWDAFQRRLQRSRESKTTLTREDWMVPFLELLGFEQLVIQRASAEAGGETFFISHRAGEDDTAPPVHIVALDEKLDQRSGTGRRSPHAVVQEYLNRSDALWGITTNGSRLRLLRDTARLAKPTYLEFDLDGMVESNQYSEFVLLYRLMHASRFPLDGAAPHECLLEKYYQQGIDEGGRVRDKLREGVEEALRVLGTAFLSHPESGDLRERVRGGALDAPSYYRQLLRLVYRFLFLMVAEERRLIFPPRETDLVRHAVYEKYYSVSRLRERCERYFAGDSNDDLWQGLVTTFKLFRDNEAAKKLGLSALDGQLFNELVCADLEGAACTNERLLTALRYLSTFVDEGPGRRRRRASGQRRRVNYAGLDVEELGSVYESLLDFHPQVGVDPPGFDLITGSERKQTGSYYTPPELVRELIGSALVPVMEERLSKAKGRDEKEATLLAMRVCDPASGSGHFLLAAARRIARELAKVRSGEEEPTPEVYREAVRDVIRHCLYAVDKNPLAVDLCKVALWLEGHSAGLPLSFLDHQVKCGDSLVGVFDLDVLTQGIPDDAYKPVTGDDKSVASSYRKRNKQEREGQLRFGAEELSDTAAELAPEFAALSVEPERTAEDIHAKEELYEELRGRGGQWWKYKVACDLWTAGFFTLLRPTDGSQPDLVPTSDTVRRFLAQPDAAHGQVVGHAVGLSLEHRFFHWPLEFPEVFAQGGFDVVLGNPPWERIKLQEQEFFAGRSHAIYSARNAAARKSLIAALSSTDPALWAAWSAASNKAENESQFVRFSGRYPLCGKGDVNTYSLFAELSRSLLAQEGRAGLIVPTGIATDDTTKEYFADLISRKNLAAFYGFENEAKLFKGVDHRVNFCLLVLSIPEISAPSFSAFVRQPEMLRGPDRVYELTLADISAVNPNTRTCPVFRTRRDAMLNLALYRRAGVLWQDNGIEKNPWDLRFLSMFHMANDSSLFLTREQLTASGHRLVGRRIEGRGRTHLPLFEAKMVYHFNHRFGDFALLEPGEREHILPQVPDERLADPLYFTSPRYWIDENEVNARCSSVWSAGWLLGWRDVTDPRSSVRTVVACAIPRAAVSGKFPLLLSSSRDLGPLYANLCSFALDYAARQKIGGVSLSMFIMKQLPLFPPETYGSGAPWSPEATLRDWLRPRVLELTYTAWDLQPFAHDLGYHGPPFRWDEQRRFLLRCELDAAFFHLYGIEREDVDYIMETFPIVKRRDEEQHGEYRTKRVILEVYDAMAEAMRTGKPYQTLLDPPPADPRVAHPARKGTA